MFYCYWFSCPSGSVDREPIIYPFHATLVNLVQIDLTNHQRAHEPGRVLPQQVGAEIEWLRVCER